MPNIQQKYWLRYLVVKMYSQITIPASITPRLTVYQKDWLIKSGFAINTDASYIRGVKNDQLHIVIGQLSSKGIQFQLKIGPTQAPTPCRGCKR